jgi:hypothetical protein
VRLRIKVPSQGGRGRLNEGEGWGLYYSCIAVEFKVSVNGFGQGLKKVTYIKIEFFIICIRNVVVHRVVNNIE